MTQDVIKIKQIVKHLPCLGIPILGYPFIVETDASNKGYRGVLKQKIDGKEKLIRYYSGTWNNTQFNYSTVKKEVLAIVLCINTFQDDLINQHFTLRIDCQSIKFILQKDVKNLVAKQIFARWQALLANFDFDIEYINGCTNSIADYLTREFLQTDTRIPD